MTATFEPAPDHPVLRLLAENGLEADGTLILRRIQSADGRTRAFINDVAVGVQLLREVGQALVEIHGQHDDSALIDPSGHRDLVDAFGGLYGEAKQSPRPGRTGGPPRTSGRVTLAKSPLSAPMPTMSAMR